MLTLMKWKLILLCVLSALAGSAVGITLVKVNAPAAVECPKAELPAETFKWVKPGTKGRDQGF